MKQLYPVEEKPQNLIQKHEEGGVFTLLPPKTAKRNVKTKKHRILKLWGVWNKNKIGYQLLIVLERNHFIALK